MLTPRHRFRQLDPSWFLNGQTTSLLASDAEKEAVNEVLGGMPGGCGFWRPVVCREARASKDKVEVEYIFLWICIGKRYSYKMLKINWRKGQTEVRMYE